MSLLLNYYPGLDLERRDQRGLTALMKAAMRDRSECVAALLMTGATDVKSAVIVAERKGNGVEMEDQSRLILRWRGVCLASHYQQSPAIDIAL